LGVIPLAIEFLSFGLGFVWATVFNQWSKSLSIGFMRKVLSFWLKILFFHPEAPMIHSKTHLFAPEQFVFASESRIFDSNIWIGEFPISFWDDLFSVKNVPFWLSVVNIETKFLLNCVFDP
jgi:hypothetical protein